MIDFATSRGRFNHRVAGVAIRDGHVLLQGAETTDFWVLPGGRVEMGEPSAIALTREMDEELGTAVEVTRPLWIVENFFVHAGWPFHELGMYYEMTVPDVDHLALNREYRTREVSGDTIFFRWFPLDRLRDVKILPDFLYIRLQHLPAHPELLVHYD